MRLVLDTSVLVTAIRSSAGATAEAIRLALARKFTLLLDLSLALEYRDVLLRPEQLKASLWSRKETLFFLEQLEALAEPTEALFTYRPLSIDPDDDMILELAINGRADAIVTNNLKHFRGPAAKFGIEVITPRECLSRLARKGV